MKRFVALVLLGTLTPTIIGCGTQHLESLSPQDARSVFSQEPVGGVTLATGDTVRFLREPPARLVNDTIYARLSDSEYYRVGVSDVESVLVTRFSVDSDSEANDALAAGGVLGGLALVMLIMFGTGPLLKGR